MNFKQELEKIRVMLMEADDLELADAIETAVEILDSRADQIAVLINERNQAQAARKTAENRAEEQTATYIEMRTKWRRESNRMFNVIEKVGDLHDAVVGGAPWSKSEKLDQLFDALIAYREHRDG